MKLFDVTLRLSTSLPTYPGNPEFAIEPVKRIANGDSANVSLLRLGTHSGTHVDAPRHFIEGAPGVDALPLEVLLGRVLVIEVPTRRAITPDSFADTDLSGELRVLFKTANSLLWGTTNQFTKEYAYLSEPAARVLVEQGIKLVGIDYLSVEEFHKPGAPAHHLLLDHGVVIIEGLNLADVDAGVYDLCCLPLPVAGADGAPARVILRRP